MKINNIILISTMSIITLHFAAPAEVMLVIEIMNEWVLFKWLIVIGLCIYLISPFVSFGVISTKKPDITLPVKNEYGDIVKRYKNRKKK